MKRKLITITDAAEKVVKEIRKKKSNFSYSKELSDYTEKELKKKYKVK